MAVGQDEGGSTAAGCKITLSYAASAEEWLPYSPHCTHYGRVTCSQKERTARLESRSIIMAAASAEGGWRSSRTHSITVAGSSCHEGGTTTAVCEHHHGCSVG
jgi:hypothetical protein